MRLFLLPSLLLLTSVVFGLDTDINRKDTPYDLDISNLYTGQCGRRIIGSRGMRSLDPLSLDREVLPDDDVVPAIERRIIGGSYARLGEFPWVASISIVGEYGSGDPSKFCVCGATIINEFWLVTAAHCFDYIKLSDTVIDVGDWNLREDKDPGQQTFQVDKLISHEKYDPDILFDNDIALIKVKPSAAGKGIQFNNYVQPVCLPGAGDTFHDGTMCVVAGWGRTNLNTNGNGYLKKLDEPVVNQQKCTYWYSMVNMNVSNLVLCAGDMKGGSGTCHGDSGSGLFCKTARGYTLAGVVSGGEPCALPNLPGLYVRVTSFISWIHSSIEQDSGN